MGITYINIDFICWLPATKHARVPILLFFGKLDLGLMLKKKNLSSFQTIIENRYCGMRMLARFCLTCGSFSSVPKFLPMEGPQLAIK